MIKEPKKLNKRIKGININYPVGDFVSRIKNAVMAEKKEVVVRKTKLVLSVAETLKKIGIIREIKIDKKEKDQFIVVLAYSNKKPVFTDIRIISKPGLRVYMNTDQLEKHKKPSILILSTPFGILSLKEALKKNSGGEIVAEVF